MKYLELIEIKNALTDLGKEKLPVAYEIAKNIRLCNNAIQETADVTKTLFESYADKDTKGVPINYPVENEPDKTQMRISDPEELKQYQLELFKALEADHVVEFVKIPKSKIQSEKLIASMVVPLIDVIIE
jgi:hypothetical protein